MIAHRENDLLTDSAKGPPAPRLRAFCFLRAAQVLLPLPVKRTALVRMISECVISVQFRGMRYSHPTHIVRGITYLAVMKEFFLCGTRHALSRLRCICTESAEQILKK
jgi:hypothetical protein